MSKLLFGLIKTLNKTEKRLFNDYLKNYNRKTDYLNLIKVYSSYEEYSKDLDKKVFKSSNNKYKISCKNSFKTKLLRFLSEIKKKDVNYDIQYLLDSAQVLKSRFFYDEALKTLNKALKIAVKNELYIYAIQILSRIIKVEIFEGTLSKHKYIDINYLKKLQEQRLHIINKYMAYVKVEDRHEIELISFDKFINPYVKIKSKKAQEITFNASVFNFKALEVEYYQILQKIDMKGSIEILIKLIAFVENDFKNKRREFHGKYLKFVNDLIILKTRFKLIKEIPTYIAKYDSFQPISRLDALKLTHYKTMSSLIYAFESYDYAFAKNQVDLFLAQFAKLVRNKKLCRNTLFLAPYFFLATNNIQQCDYALTLSSTIKFSYVYKKHHTILQALIIYEKDDMPYFEKFLQSKFKKKESGSGLHEIENFINAVLKVLKSISGNREDRIYENMSLVYKNYCNHLFIEKVIIFYLVNKLKYLQDSKYQKFLKAKQLNHLKLIYTQT